MREAFAPILTRWEPSEGEGYAIVQLQLIDRKAHALMHHRLDFCSFASDRLILEHHLVLHRINFIRKGGGVKEQIGDYTELFLEVQDLWEVGRRLGGPKGDVQVLLMEEGVKKVMDIEALRPFLPERLKKVDIVGISQKRERGDVESDPNLQDDPLGRGGKLDLLS